MRQLILGLQPEELIQARFSDAGLDGFTVERRDYPEESIFVVRVNPVDFDVAARLGNDVDHEIANLGVKGFITIRKKEETPAFLQGFESLSDPKINHLVDTIIARSRTSEVQPSLKYIGGMARDVNAVLAARHQIVFGRRGAGKTALLAEAKRRVDEQKNLSVWVNLQTLRLEAAPRAFIFILQRVCTAIQRFLAEQQKTPHVLTTVLRLQDELDARILDSTISTDAISHFIPLAQQILRRFSESTSAKVYIFIDELHYIARNQQPSLLDMVHGIVRDCDAWLKIAGIKHLSRWFQSTPPLGLQTGQDADAIDLDITLENPRRAKSFLEEILLSYAKTAGLGSLGSIFLKETLDRLVLASGAVPRDYLILSAGAIREAQRRERARSVGVQDVNKAAGEAAKVKISELEDDASSSGGQSEILAALQKLRHFCVDVRRCTYFRIDFRDKEQNPRQYSSVQDLVDLRLLHLVDSSLSDENEAGRRSEVYILDLSQFSGQRLKKRLKVLDFEDGHLVIKETGTKIIPKIGDTPKKRLGLLRRGPLLALSVLTGSSELPP